MELTVANKHAEPELHRTRYTAHLAYDNAATPSRVDVAKKLADKTKVQADLIVVKNIKTNFGIGGATVDAVAYDSVEHLKRVETPAKAKAAPK